MAEATPNPSPGLRAARPEDGPEIIQLVNSVYRGRTGRQWTSEAHLVRGPRLDAAMYGDALRRPRSVILLLGGSDPDRIVGCVHLEADGETCELGMLSVRADVQQSGYGRILLERAEAWARDRWRIGVMTLHVITARTELLEWYRRRGYAPTGERLPFGGDAASRSEPIAGPLEFEVLTKRLADTGRGGAG